MGRQLDTGLSLTVQRRIKVIFDRVGRDVRVECNADYMAMVCCCAVGARNLKKGGRKGIRTACRLENMLCFPYQNEMTGLQCIITFTTRKKSVLHQMNVLQESVGGNVSRANLSKQ